MKQGIKQAIKQRMKKAKWLNLLYPPVCPLCRRLLSDEERMVCLECEKQIPYIAGHTCAKCGKELSVPEELCADCRKTRKSYVRGFPAMRYEGAVKESIRDLKYKNKREFAPFFAYEIQKRQGKNILEAAPEALVPVPIHRFRRWKRGYNQAELLADRLSEYLNVPVETNLLFRTVNTAPQKNLDPSQRKNNLKKAFHSGDNIVKYKRVMLVDDIYTTGATVEACAKALYDAGIQEVYYTSACIGKGS